MTSKKLLAMARSCEEFLMDVHKNAPGKEQGFIFSPFGAHLVLSISAYGADGDAKFEMMKGLRLPKKDSEGLKGLQALLNNLKIRIGLQSVVIGNTELEGRR